MAETVTDWAGALRRFYLPLGKIIDIEEACGKVGIGAIYLRIARHEYFANDVRSVIKYGLIGGGLSPLEAEALLRDRFDVTPLVESAELALSILVDRMSGIEKDETKSGGDPAKPYDVGAIFASFAKAGIPPESLRQMDYAAFVAMCRALGGDSVQPPSEQEFKDMLARMMPNG